MDSSIITTDLHLTSNPRDEYRWGFFTWLLSFLTKCPAPIRHLWILGDLTDAKDFHSAQLVNRVVDVLEEVHRKGGIQYIWVLCGNHDGTDPGCPYFRFLTHLPFVQFITTPSVYEVMRGMRVLMLPHSRQPETEWAQLDVTACRYILMHATMRGAVAENGQQLEGVPVARFAGTKATIFSGDVHVPQVVGNVEYVGAPYRVHFGDGFVPRCLLFLDGVRQNDLHPDLMLRHSATVTTAEQLATLIHKESWKKGDQVKVRIALEPSEFVDWHDRKLAVQRVCEMVGLELCDVSLQKIERPKIMLRGVSAPVVVPGQQADVVVERYCTKRGITGITREVGLELVRNA